MGRYLEEYKGQLLSVAAKKIGLEDIRTGGSGVARKILKLLSIRPHYSHEIAKSLKLNEQLIYYHTRKLEGAGLIEEERREAVQGGSARYFRLCAPAFSVVLGKMQETEQVRAQIDVHQQFLNPFISEGRPSFHMVVGSPDAHGPSMVRAKDGGYASDLALFLGSFCSERPGPVLRLDTEFAHSQFKDNLIVIGGPIVNTVAMKINKKLPIRFDEEGMSIVSKSGKVYEGDEIGIIVKTPNPYAPKKSILYIAGRRQAGTKAAILAFLLKFDKLIETHKEGRIARVVRGLDLDSDGVIDDVVFEA